MADAPGAAFDLGMTASSALHVTCVMAKSRVSERVRSHRQRLRAQGLRPVQIWVPDVRAPEFAAEAHRQAVAVASSKHAVDDQAFIDAAGLDDEE